MRLAHLLVVLLALSIVHTTSQELVCDGGGDCFLEDDDISGLYHDADELLARRAGSDTDTHNWLKMFRREVYEAAREGHDMDRPYTDSSGEHEDVWAALEKIQPGHKPGTIRAFFLDKDIDADHRDHRRNQGKEVWNREHLWPKSHGFKHLGSKIAPHNDLHHLRATEKRANSFHNSRGYAIVRGTRGAVKLEPDDADDYDCDCYAKGSGTSGFFEPPDKVKGEVARALMYMDVRYEGNEYQLISGRRNKLPDLRLVRGATSTHTNKLGDVCALLRWHMEYPVSDRERSEHEARAEAQGNRNPMVDRPLYPIALWGRQCGVEVPPQDSAEEFLVDVEARERDTLTGMDATKARARAHQLAAKDHDPISWGKPMWRALRYTDEHPNPAFSEDHVMDVFSRKAFPKINSRHAHFADKWNREHIWPQSHGYPKKKIGHSFAHTDLHQLRASAAPTNNNCHNDRDYDHVHEEHGEACQWYPDSSFVSDKVAKATGTPRVFEPSDASKGEVARALLYMDVRYEGDDFARENTPDLRLVKSNEVPTERVAPGEGSDVGKLGALCTVLRWHEDFPVTEFERERHDRVVELQGNVNPFILYPNLANSIYAGECSE